MQVTNTETLGELKIVSPVPLSITRRPPLKPAPEFPLNRSKHFLSVKHTRGKETCRLYPQGANLELVWQRSNELFFLYKGQPLCFKGQPNHPKKCNLKVFWGHGGTPKQFPFRMGKPGKDS